MYSIIIIDFFIFIHYVTVQISLHFYLKKMKLLNKLFRQWKNVYDDYFRVVVTTYLDCVANPTRSCLVFGVASGVYYIKSNNPNELSYRSAVLDTRNRFILVSNSIRNPRAVEHLKMIDRSLSQGLIRHSDCGLFSIIWIDEYDDDVSLYKTNCPYLSRRWIKIPSKIIDVGFLGQWWILKYKMINSDVNIDEFEQRLRWNVPNLGTRRIDS